jgi:cytochrome P450
MDLGNVVVDRVARRVVSGPFAPRTDGLPPGPATPPVAQLLAFLFTPGPFLRACRARYGSHCTLRLPGTPPLVQFSEPDAVKDVFAAGADTMHAGKANGLLEPFVGTYSVLVLDGARHRSQRRLLLPPFRGDRMRAYGEAMREITEAQMAGWTRAGTFRMQRETQIITLEVILRTVFGMQDDAHGDLDRMRSLLVTWLGMVDNPLFLITRFQRDLGPRSPWGKFLRHRAAIYREMDAFIAKRRREGAREDILSMLLEAKHEDGAPMSDEEIRDELLTLLVAGHETTATALSWAIHRLSVHPEVLEKAQAEIDAAFGSGPVVPDTKLPYVDALCKEVLRVHPVIPGVGRLLMEPERVGGLDLPAGVMIGCSIYLTHLNPAVWPDPERFDPMRFVDTKPPPHAFFPFGGGLRRCIGEAFALYEMRIVLATILQKMSPVAVATRVITMRRNITLTPSQGLPIRFLARA